MRTLAAALAAILISVMADEARAESAAPACGAMDFSDVESIRACVEAEFEAIRARKRPTHALGRLQNSNYRCGELQVALARAKLAATDPGAVGFVNDSRGPVRGKRDHPMPSCETLAEVTRSYAGESPVWLACLGWRPGADHVAHAAACIDAIVFGALGKGRPEQGKLRLATTCGGLESQLDLAYGFVHRPDPRRGTYRASLPEGFPPFVCAEFAGYLERNAALKDEGARELAALIAARRKSRAAMAAAMAALDRDYDFSARRAEMVAAMRAGVHPPDRIGEEQMREAVAGEIHRLYPEERMRLGATEAARTHTTHGVWLDIRSQPPATASFGVAEISGLSCDLVAGAADCEVILTVGESLAVVGAAAPKVELATGIPGLGRRTTELSLRLRHDGRRWAVERDEALIRFLAPPP